MKKTILIITIDKCCEDFLKKNAVGELEVDTNLVNLSEAGKKEKNKVTNRFGV